MALPLVSCYCTTYGQPRVLEESIESFLRQDYEGPKELVIVNDCGEQTLVLNHPEIRIYNYSERIYPFGKRLNTAAKHCNGSILLCWDDDDIFLPNRISYTVSHMDNGVFYTASGLSENPNGYNAFCDTSVFISTYACTRDVFDAIGGYQEIDHALVPTYFIYELLRYTNNQTLALEDVFYIYRWNTLAHPQTILKSDLSNNQRSFLIAHKIIESGTIKLNPHWNKNYNYIDYQSITYGKSGPPLADTDAFMLNPPVRQNGKIAYMFMIYDEINHEEAWAEYFSQIDPATYTIYIHQKFPKTLTHLQKFVISDQVQNVTYGGIGIVNMQLLLLELALTDLRNSKFVILSNACIPLKPASEVHQTLMANQYSHISLSPRGQVYPRCDHLYGRLDYETLHKSSNWCILNREHATACILNDEYRHLLHDVWVPEELYFLSTLKKHVKTDVVLYNGNQPEICTTFTNWHGMDYPYASQYALKTYEDISSKELDLLRHSPCLFGRKFSPKCVVDGDQPLSKNIIGWLRTL